LPLRLGDFLEHGLEALLEFTAILRASDERAEVERNKPFVLEALGTSPATMRRASPSNDGGLADRPVRR